MNRLITLTGAALVLLCLAVRPAASQQKEPVRILILNPESRFLSSAKLESLGEQLRTLAKRYPSLAICEDPGMQGKLLRIRARCQGAGKNCLARMASLAKVRRILYSEIQKLPGRYLAVMKLVDADSQDIVEQSRQRCGKEMASIRNALLKGWVEIQGPLIRSQLAVVANVTGADVFLDGNKIGRTPLVLTKDIGRGTHLVEVRQQGFDTALREIKITGGSLKVAVKLKKAVLTTAKPAVEEPPASTAAGRVKHAGQVARGEVVGEKLGGGKADIRSHAIATRPSLGRKPVALSRKAETGPVATEPSKPFLPRSAEQTAQPPSRPLYKQWWFWTAIGVAVAGGVTGLVLGLSPEGGIPSGKGRVAIEFW
ncbi:MAG TPA: PEGA domain-containing protein [Myxococcota bacterium]|nr:PEGA domain-containing protein [Myxococcota bacterium]